MSHDFTTCPLCLDCIHCGRSMASQMNQLDPCDAATGPGHSHPAAAPRAQEWLIYFARVA